MLIVKYLSGTDRQDGRSKLKTYTVTGIHLIHWPLSYMMIKPEAVTHSRHSVTEDCGSILFSATG